MNAMKESNKVVQYKEFDMQRACVHGQHALDKHDLTLCNALIVKVFKLLDSSIEHTT